MSDSVMLNKSNDSGFDQVSEDANVSFFQSI